MTLKLSSKLSDLFDDDEEVEEVPIPKVPVKETRRLEIESVDEEVHNSLSITCTSP